jgi:hypothetical protein
MKKFLLLLFFFTTFYHLFGQVTNSGGSNVISNTNFGFIHGDHLPDNFLKYGNKTIKYKDVDGTPYINVSSM